LLGAWLDAERSDLTLGVSLLFFLLFPIGDGVVRALSIALAVAGLLHAGTRRAPAVWGLLALLATWRVVDAWPLPDNHAYLLVYWCLALCLSRRASDSEGSQALSARWLVALVFAFAAAWKLVLSDDYLDVFYRVLLLGDERFADLAIAVGGLAPADLAANRDAVAGGALESPFPLVEPPRFRALAAALTWGSALSESALAALFAAPLGSRLRWLRDAGLVVFCAVTYAIAPVAGFGWLLLAMGFAQCPAGRPRLRLLYLAGFGLVVLHDAIAWIPLVGGAPG
jgi:hypothetical protein